MKLGLIGCGKMGRSLLSGVLAKGAVDPTDVTVHSRTRAAVDKLVTEEGVNAAKDLKHLVEKTDTILLCVKPYQMVKILNEIAEMETSEESHLIISVAAGITIETMEDAVKGRARIIRSMPNTPSMIGKGATAYSLGTKANEHDEVLAETIFRAVGIACKVEENLINSVTGVSGSGPAYIYLVIEAMADGGVLAGLPREIAIELATQTVLGASAMVKTTGHHPAVLKDMVTSPGGTTIAGLQTLEDHGVRAAFINTVMDVKERADELGN